MKERESTLYPARELVEPEEQPVHAEVYTSWEEAKRQYNEKSRARTEKSEEVGSANSLTQADSV